ncbi:MAG: ABC transporter permease subunit [Chloroflexota bacterium]
MSTNIFGQEFRMHLRSVIIWAAAIAALLFIYVAMFSSFAEDTELMMEMLSNFPPQLLTAFGMENVEQMSTVLGYFGFAFLFAQLCLAIQAAGYGFSLVSVEEREWTADFLLSKPVARTRILTSKLLAALAGLTLTNLSIWICSFVFITLFKGDRAYETRPLLLLLLSIVVFQLFFFSVGLVISLLVKRIRSVTPYAMALGFGMYVLSVFGDMLGESTLELLTPFKHFDPGYIIDHGAYDLPLALISVAVIVISLVGSYLLYSRRDIPAVV